MINTEKFEFVGRNMDSCYEGCLDRVNKLINDKHLRREDILEYRTEDFDEYRYDDKWYHLKVTISWWE